MWTRDDIQREADAARERAVRRDCHSVPILARIMMDVAARMALDNAATVAESHGDPTIEDAINALKDQFPLGE